MIDIADARMTWWLLTTIHPHRPVLVAQLSHSRGGIHLSAAPKITPTMPHMEMSIIRSMTGGGRHRATAASGGGHQLKGLALHERRERHLMHQHGFNQEVIAPPPPM
jgi:hypothetical protein